LSASTWPPEGQPPAAPTGPVDAAVLVPLFERGGAVRAVLTRRRDDLRRHAGEMSFPGGRRDADDESFEHTALREAHEEIGLERRAARVFGELPSVSTFVTGYVIHPVLAAIEPPRMWRPQPREVAAVLELELDAIRAGAGFVELERRGISFSTACYRVDGHVIWGATARILDHLFARIDDGHGVRDELVAP